MPELREVYFMVTEQRSPAPGALDRQRDRQHRSLRNRKLGTIALSAALVVAAILVVMLAGTDAANRGERTNEPAVQPTSRLGRPGRHRQRFPMISRISRNRVSLYTTVVVGLSMIHFLRRMP